jgi:hypothetical protein
MAGYPRKTARTGGVKMIRRFGSKLNLNIHYLLVKTSDRCVPNAAPHDVIFSDRLR